MYFNQRWTVTLKDGNEHEVWVFYDGNMYTASVDSHRSKAHNSPQSSVLSLVLDNFSDTFDEILPPGKRKRADLLEEINTYRKLVSEIQSIAGCSNASHAETVESVANLKNDEPPRYNVPPPRNILSLRTKLQPLRDT